MSTKGFYIIFFVENIIPQLSRLSHNWDDREETHAESLQWSSLLKGHNRISRSISIRIEEIDKKRTFVTTKSFSTECLQIVALDMKSLVKFEHKIIQNKWIYHSLI